LLMARTLENVTVVGIATVGSRLLGLLRDVMIFAMLGTGAVNSAFLVAFTLPNLFRRMLGEGALTSAVVPLLAEELEKNQKEEAFRFFNQVLTRVGILLVVLVAAGTGLLFLLGGIGGLPGHWYLGIDLGIVLLPYMVVVCLAALMAAALNVLQRFTVAALSQVWLNLAMIISLGVFGYLLGHSPEERVLYLCAGVLVGGVLQVIIPALALKRQGWRPVFDLKPGARLSELNQLLIPGLAGATIFQVNIAVSRLLAFSLDDSSVTFLYLANRLIELPLGVFAIAVTTVLFPAGARLAAQERFEQFAASYHQGMRLIFAITIPAALGLIVLREPIIDLLFVWGKFGASDVMRTSPILLIGAIGLPFYAWATFTTRHFHALKNMRTPVRLAFINFVLNVILSLLLMGPYGVAGLAAANVVAIIVHSLALRWLLGRQREELGRDATIYPLVKILAAGAIMGVVTWLSWQALQMMFEAGKLSALLGVFGIISLAMVIYFGLLWAFRFEEKEEVRALVLKLVGRGRGEARVVDE